MFKVGDAKQDAQFKMAPGIEEPGLPVGFNVVKGSVPARTDVSDAAFDACGKKGMADLKEASEKGTLFGSLAHGHAAPAAVKNAIYDVITRHFNGQYTADQAVAQLVAGGRRAPSNEHDLDRSLPAAAPPGAALGRATGRRRIVHHATTQRRDPASRQGRPGSGCSEFLPQLVLAPSFAAVLLFVYGFILFTGYLSFTDSKILPVFDFVGFGRTTSRLWSPCRTGGSR